MLTITQIIHWNEAYSAALLTENKIVTDKEPSDKWKRQILLAEHSPIRVPTYKITWSELPSWVATHFTRHHVGVEKFVGTQRPDRTGKKRDNEALVPLSLILNCNSIINISRKRLCKKSSKETQDAWLAVKREMLVVDPVLASVMVPECIYRGFCPEAKTCGYYRTDSYKTSLDYYRGAAANG